MNLCLSSARGKCDSRRFCAPKRLEVGRRQEYSILTYLPIEREKAEKEVKGGLRFAKGSRVILRKLNCLFCW